MAGLSEKQKQALREKAAKEAAERAAREEAAVGKGRRSRDRELDGVPGPPMGLVAVLVLLAMIGGAIALGFWLSSASVPGRATKLPDDFGTSEDKGGYISEEGLPERGGEHDVSVNPADGDNVVPGEETEAGGDPYGGAGSGGETPAATEDPVAEEAVRVHLPEFITGTSDPGSYAAERGWIGSELEADGSAVYLMTQEQREAALGDCLGALRAAVDNASGAFSAVTIEDEESYMTFGAYLAEGHEDDTEGWRAAASPILSAAAERLAFAGRNTLAPTMTVYARNGDGTARIVGSVFYVNGSVMASAQEDGG